MARLQSQKDKPNTSREYETTYILRPNTPNEGVAEVNARITSIYPVFDGHIPEGSALEGAVNIEVPVRGHFRILVEQVALDAIVSAVDGVD